MHQPYTHRSARVPNRSCSYICPMVYIWIMGYLPSLLSAEYWEAAVDITFPLSCTAMPTRDGARQIPHDPYAKPCRCRACRRLWWTFPKAGYRCIAYYQSRPYAYLAYNNTPIRSTSQIMHTIHHHIPNPIHRRSNSSKTSSGMSRTGRLRKMS